MGRAEKGSITPPAIGNLELMKVPNLCICIRIFNPWKMLTETSALVPDNYCFLGPFIQIPNFFHLTSLHIQKHCEALKRKSWVVVCIKTWR